MLKKILIFLILSFFGFSNTFSDWKNDIDTGNYKNFLDKYPNKINILKFESFKINNNGEFVIEYNKEYYYKLLDVYGGKNILIFDPKNTEKYKLNSKIEFNDDKVIITILKNNLDFIYDSYIKSSDNNFIFNYFYGNISLYIWDYINFENRNDFLKDIINGNFKNINNYIDENLINQNGLGYINGKIYIESYDINNIIFEKYKNYYIKDLESYTNINIENGISFKSQLFGFAIDDKEVLLNFLKDQSYYMFFLKYFNYTKGELIFGNDLIFKNDSEISIKQLFSGFQNLDISYYVNSLECNFFDNSQNGNGNYCIVNYWKGQSYLTSEPLYVNISDYIYKNNFNISKLLDFIHSKGFLLGYSISDINQLYINGEGVVSEFNFGYEIKSILPITDIIKSPKTISSNPYLISINFLLAILYLLTFYFTSQLFNSYFERLSNENKLNEIISKNIKNFISSPFKITYNSVTKLKNRKIIFIINKIRLYLCLYEHKIYIIIGFLLLGIIGQIVVDDFDIFSLKGWIIIILMIFILSFITLFKDILLYLFNKGKAKEKLKLENVPIGFIFAGLVAILGRFIGMIPGLMFGTVIKLNTKSNIILRQTSNPILLFKILFIIFLVGFISWVSTIFFDANSFIYKFLIITYFGLINDVFFSLLPFGMLWGIYILKDKKLKIKWFVFTFIIFFFLLHTILHGEGDLNKLMQFNGNFIILIGILFFWILMTTILYLILKNKNIIKNKF